MGGGRPGGGDRTITDNDTAILNAMRFCLYQSDSGNLIQRRSREYLRPLRKSLFLKGLQSGGLKDLCDAVDSKFYLLRFFQVSEKEVGTWLKAIDLKRTLSRELIENKEG
jgi:hypothetical protein